MNTNKASEYRSQHCDECGYEYEIEVQPDGTILADGYTPVEDEGTYVLFDVPHRVNGYDCEATLLVRRS